MASSSPFRPCQKYVCSYRHDDAQWNVILTAYDVDDARDRVAKLGSLQLDGELHATIECGQSNVRATGILMQATCNAMNLLRRVLHR
jgi:hypothetical protein